MGITVFKDNLDSDRTYLRVTRAVNGEEQQRYVRVMGTGKGAMEKAMREAEKIDANLRKWQEKVRSMLITRGEGLINSDGAITGLQLQKRQRKGRKPVFEFKIRVKKPDQPAVFRSVSVDRYGFDEAYTLAVNKLCEMRGLDPDSKGVQKLLSARPFYEKRFEELTRSRHSAGYPMDAWLGAFSTFFKRA